MECAKNGAGSLVIKNDHAITARSDVRMVNCRDRILVTVRCSNGKWNEGGALEALPDLVDHARRFYTKNFPPSMILSSSNQMSKSRPTQSMCVFETQFAPVCSE
jgi:hypothetical protein